MAANAWIRNARRLIPALLIGSQAGCVGQVNKATELSQQETERRALPDFDAMWDYSDPRGTESKFRDLLTGDGDLPPGYEAELRTQIARTLGLQHRFDEAHAMLDGLEPRLAALPPVVRVRHRLERGRVFNSAGDAEAARPLFEEALRLASHAGIDDHAVDALHMIAIVAPPNEALWWNERALAVAEDSDDARARRWRASLLNNIGWTHHDRGRYQDAMTAFERALAVRVESGDEKSIRIARWCVARTHRSLGDCDAAFEILRDLEHSGQADAPDGYVCEEIAECLLSLGRADEARPYFRRAHAVLSEDPWLVEAEPGRLARLKELGAPPE